MQRKFAAFAMELTADNAFKVDIGSRHILKLAAPLAASMWVPQINFITNNIFLGHLGKNELAVAGITGVYYLIFSVIGLGLSNGLQVLLSRRAGEGKLHDIGSLFAQAVRIALVIALLGCLITWFIAPTVLSYSLHSSKDVEMATSFLTIRIFGLFFLYVYQMRNALLVSTNLSRYLIIGTLAETLTNIFLDYGLIFGHFGLPAMGFNGAALASVCAEFMGMLSLVLLINVSGLAGKFSFLKNTKLHKGNIRLLLNQSAPLMLQFSFSIAIWEYFYILIEHHGETDLAISSIMRNIFGFFGCITWAFAATTNSMVSNIIGQGREKNVSELLRNILRLTIGVSLVIVTVVNLFPEVFLKAYGQSEDFVQLAVPVIRVVSVALLFQSFSLVWLNAVTGTGNSKRNLYTEIFSLVIYTIYVYVVLEKLNLSIIIGWVSEWIYWMCLFVPSYIYMRSNKWMNRKL